MNAGAGTDLSVSARKEMFSLDWHGCSGSRVNTNIWKPGSGHETILRGKHILLIFTALIGLHLQLLKEIAVHARRVRGLGFSLWMKGFAVVTVLNICLVFCRHFMINHHDTIFVVNKTNHNSAFKQTYKTNTNWNSKYKYYNVFFVTFESSGNFHILISH